MSRIVEALNAIDTAIEALELLTKQESTDFVSEECISMLTGLVHQEMSLQSGIIRGEIKSTVRKEA